MIHQDGCRHPGPCGRCAVGLRPSLDPTPILTDPIAAEEDQINGTREVDISGATDKQGDRLVRWAAVEAVQRVGPHPVLGAFRDQVAARRGRNIGVVAAARRQIEYVFYALRDHHVRALGADHPRAA